MGQSSSDEHGVGWRVRATQTLMSARGFDVFHHARSDEQLLVSYLQRWCGGHGLKPAFWWMRQDAKRWHLSPAQRSALHQSASAALKHALGPRFARLHTAASIGAELFARFVTEDLSWDQKQQPVWVIVSTCDGGAYLSQWVADLVQHRMRVVLVVCSTLRGGNGYGLGQTVSEIQNRFTRSQVVCVDLAGSVVFPASWPTAQNLGQTDLSARFARSPYEHSWLLGNAARLHPCRLFGGSTPPPSGTLAWFQEVFRLVAQHDVPAATKYRAAQAYRDSLLAVAAQTVAREGVTTHSSCQDLEAWLTESQAKMEALGKRSGWIFSCHASCLRNLLYDFPSHAVVLSSVLHLLQCTHPRLSLNLQEYGAWHYQGHNAIFRPWYGDGPNNGLCIRVVVGPRPCVGVSSSSNPVRQLLSSHAGAVLTAQSLSK